MCGADIKLTLIHAFMFRSLRVDPNSVNCVAVDDEPQDPHDRLMVAGFVGLNPTGSSMMARDTTVMPLIPGLPAILSLLFCPVAEFRLVSTMPDKLSSYFISYKDYVWMKMRKLLFKFSQISD